MSGATHVRPELMALFLAVGLGTYLLRAVPLLGALARLAPAPGRPRADGPRGRPGSRTDNPEAGPRGEGPAMLALRLVAPAVVAALLVGSVLPPLAHPAFWEELGVSLAALIPTLWVAVRRRNLGLTVLAGVVSYWALGLLR